MKNKPGLLLIYSPTCPYCHAMFPEYNNLYKSAGDVLNIFALNGPENINISSKLKVPGYPTILFVNKHGKVSSEFKKERTAAEMKKFVCANLTDSLSGYCPK